MARLAGLVGLSGPLPAAELKHLLATGGEDTAAKQEQLRRVWLLCWGVCVGEGRRYIIRRVIWS